MPRKYTAMAKAAAWASTTGPSVRPRRRRRSRRRRGGRRRACGGSSPAGGRRAAPSVRRRAGRRRERRGSPPAGRRAARWPRSGTSSGCTQSAPHHLVGLGEVGARVGERADAAARLQPDRAAVGPDDVEHHGGRRERGAHLRLAGGGLDEVGAAGRSRGAAPRRSGRGSPSSPVSRITFRRWPSPVGTSARTASTSVDGDAGSPGGDGAVREDDVDLVGTVGERPLGLGQHVGERLGAAREVRHRRDAHRGRRRSAERW